MKITESNAALFLACLTAAACTPLQSPFANPEKTVRDFHKNLLFRNCKRAFSQLTEGTRLKLTQLAKSAAEQSSGAVSADPASMLCQGDISLYKSESLSGDDVVQVVLTSRDDQAGTALVTATIGGKEWPTSLVRDAAGDWKIDLEHLADEALAKRTLQSPKADEAARTQTPETTTEKAQPAADGPEEQQPR